MKELRTNHESSSEERDQRMGQDALSGTSEFSMPNSYVSAMMRPGGAPDPNSGRSGFSADAAEKEADLLSAGMRGAASNEVRREMGLRLNADFSPVSFHSDNAGRTRADQLGARAWTQGRDVYFGRGGFDPVVAAHELVHTVQQGAVKGTVSTHAPANSIQRWPWSRREEEAEPETPAEKADFFFRMQAGLAAKKSASDAEKSGVYAKAFQKQRKQNKSLKESFRSAWNTVTNFVPGKKKNVISDNDRQRYRQYLSNITYEDYTEIMDRFENAAVMLFDYREDNDGFLEAGEQDLQAAGDTSGMDYKLYSNVVKNMRRVVPPETLAEWDARRAREKRNDPAREEKITRAAQITKNAGDPRKNAYLRTDKGAQGLADIDKATAEYYKKVYKGESGPKKKTKIDRLAEIYRAVNEQRKERNVVPSDVRSDAAGSQDSGDESVSDIIKTSVDRPAVGGEEPSVDLSAGMKENSDASEIDLNESFNAKDQSSLKTDENEIIRDRGSVNEELVEDFYSGNENVKDVKKWSGKFGFIKNVDMAANSSAQLAMLDRNHQNTSQYKDYVAPSVGGVADAIGLTTGAMGVATGIHDVIKNSKNLKAGGRKMDVFTSALDTLGSGTAMVSGGMGMMQKMGGVPGIGGAMSAAGSAGGASLIPGLNIATGMATAVSGTLQGVRGQIGINRIGKQISSLENENRDGLSQDQQNLMNIFKQGKRVQEFQRTSNTMKALSGGLAAGTGIAMLTGPLAPITAAAIGLTSVALGAGKYIYDQVKKRNLRRDIIAEELNINWETEMKRVRSMFPDEKLSDRQVRAIILKGHGFDTDSRKQALKQINLNRARVLLDTAKGGGPDALKAQTVISSLGVNRVNGRYADGAQKLLAEKLGI